MASTVRTLSLALPLIFLAASVFLDGVAAVTPREYDSMQRVLRGHGYNLVCNAMATSDLQWLLLTLPSDASFTVFAPTDAALFALDMTQTAASYTDTLRLHVVPLRLSLTDLRSLTAGSILPTLLPSSAIRLPSTRPLSVSGVDVVLPGLFYSRHVAVHGLGGILSLASLVPYGAPPSTPKDDPLAATDSNRTGLSSEIAPSSATTGSPSPFSSPTTSKHEISPASAPEAEISAAVAAPSNSPLSAADSVAEKARALLMEITSVITDDEKSKSISDVDQILGGESPPLMKENLPDVVNKLEKCGALDEMAIDCFLPESATGLEHSRFHHAVRVLT